MKHWHYIASTLSILALLSGCAGQRAMQKETTSAEVETTAITGQDTAITEKEDTQEVATEAPVTEPAWKTYSSEQSFMDVTFGKDQLSSAVRFQAIYDSILIVSATPILGIEIARLEATPTEVTILDKTKRQYATMDYETLNQYITPALRWEDLQAMASGEGMDPKTHTLEMGYSLRGKTIKIRIRYNQLLKDQPVRAIRFPKANYKETDILKW